MELVDEQDHLPLGPFDLLEHRFDPLLELAPELRTGEQVAEVEGDDPPFLEGFRDVLRHDPLGEALDDRGLPDAGLPDEDGVVLRPAGEDLDHAADLVVAADHRVELPLAGERREVLAVLLERPVLGLLRTALHRVVRPADLLQGGLDRRPTDPELL